MIRRTRIGYGLLAASWLGILLWQAVEHLRVRRSAREALVFRARDITTTLGLVIRSQARFGGFVNQERLEPALRELVKADEVISVSLLNEAGHVVATAGDPVDLDQNPSTRTGELWDERSVTLFNLIDLGTTNQVQEGERSPTIVVLPRREPGSATNSDPFNPSRFGRRPPGSRGTNTNTVASTNAAAAGNADASAAANTTGGGAAGESSARSPRGPQGQGEPRSGDGSGGRRDPSGRSWLRRPPWMSEAEFGSLIQKQGIHSFVAVLSNNSFRVAVTRDLWLRLLTSGFAAASACGFGLAWRSVAASSELQIRLLRASEMNTHLREMNIAAAGLAHETRNPLNIIRGLAQLIAKQPDSTIEIRRKSTEIANEVDRVTAQLNEFINYSKPREVRRAPVLLEAVVADLTRALECDIEEKLIRLNSSCGNFSVEADEQLLRQSLFNLLLNAIQAVERGGEVTIAAFRSGDSSVCMEIRDNGPGVPEEHRNEIFKPYFTTTQKGTGLGLAVVKQIVLAHGWDIQCVANQPRGAVFRLSHIKLSREA